MVKTNDRPYGHRKELHQLAVVEPAKECDLRIKDVVVGELSMYMPVYCSSHCKASSVMGYTSVFLLVLFSRVVWQPRHQVLRSGS